MGENTKPSDAELRARLSQEQYSITQEGATERAFTGAYLDCKDRGTYRCVCCGAALFNSESKYESGSGWPSFWLPLAGDRVRVQLDESHGMTRKEVRCGSCEAHLGHVFDDGPQPSGLRYCINSGALDLDTDADGGGSDVQPGQSRVDKE